MSEPHECRERFCGTNSYASRGEDFLETGILRVSRVLAEEQ